MDILICLSALQVIQLQGDQRKNVATFLVQVFRIFRPGPAEYCFTIPIDVQSVNTDRAIITCLGRLGLRRKRTSRFTGSKGPVNACALYCVPPHIGELEASTSY